MLSLLSLEGPLEAKEEPVIVHDDTTLHQEADVRDSFWIRHSLSFESESDDHHKRSASCTPLLYQDQDQSS